MMKKIQVLVASMLLLAFLNMDLFAQQEVTIRDLNTYETPLESLADIPNHPLTGVEVTFDAVIVGYPKNSGLANLNNGIPGRIHTFVVDVNAAEQGLDGMYMQLVTPGELRTTMESLLQGDVIRVTGALTFFSTYIGQFSATEVTQIGSVYEDPYTDLEPLLQPTPVSLGDINIPSPNVANRWRVNLDNYTNFVNRYVTYEAVEVIDRTDAPAGRPRFVTSDGVGVTYHRDISLRYRNDRPNYGVATDGSGVGLNYNWRRTQEELDGPFVVPSTGAVVNLSGFLIFDTFDPNNYDEGPMMRTFRIAPWDDGVLWIADGLDPDDRLTPPNWPNDLEVLGFAPLLDNFTVTPEGNVSSSDNVALSIDVLLPEDDYTIESVVVEYEAFGFDADSGSMVVEPMANAGNTWTYTFDSFDNFTTVNYRIVATVNTPTNIQTSASQSGSFYVESSTQTAPVTFSPGAGVYQNAVQVTLASVTENASIFYTTDGSDPDDESAEYSSALNFDATTTLKAIAIAPGLDPSPIATRVFEIEQDAIEATTIAQLRSGMQDGSTYSFTGDAVVTYTRASRNQKYIMDETGGILIDDPNPAVIASEYNIGSNISNLLGTLGAFNGVVQFRPSLDPGASSGMVDVNPEQLTLSQITIDDHESKLIFVENVTFEDEGVFASLENYTISDPTGEMIFRTNFTEANYLGDAIPTGPVNLTVIVGSFNGTLQLIARFASDIVPFTDIPAEQTPVQFELAQNYPNPFNPTTNISYSLAEVTDVNLVVYDILGRRVATLVNARQQLPGMYNVSFDASRLASGTYIYRLEAGNFVSVKKMMLVK